MGINYAKVPFIIGMFYTRKCHSKWVHFKSQTHTSGHFDIGVAPPPPPPRGDWTVLMWVVTSQWDVSPILTPVPICPLLTDRLNLTGLRASTL